jgi:RNA polymerase sigma factor (sigma-70 family)
MNPTLTEFYEKNYKNYLGRARRFLKDYHYAEDCVQEAFENALRYSDTFTEGLSLESWFNMVFLNTVRTHLSKIKAQGVVVELTYRDHPPVPETVKEMYGDIVEKEIHLYTKDEKKRLALVSYFLNGHKAKAVEIISGLSQAQVYVVAHRFMIHLSKKYLEE